MSYESKIRNKFFEPFYDENLYQHPWRFPESYQNFRKAISKYKPINEELKIYKREQLPSTTNFVTPYNYEEPQWRNVYFTKRAFGDNDDEAFKHRQIIEQCGKEKDREEIIGELDDEDQKKIIHYSDTCDVAFELLKNINPLEYNEYPNVDYPILEDKIKRPKFYNYYRMNNDQFLFGFFNLLFSGKNSFTDHWSQLEEMIDRYLYHYFGENFYDLNIVNELQIDGRPKGGENMFTQKLKPQQNKPMNRNDIVRLKNKASIMMILAHEQPFTFLKDFKLLFQKVLPQLYAEVNNYLFKQNNFPPQFLNNIDNDMKLYQKSNDHYHSYAQAQIQMVNDLKNKYNDRIQTRLKALENIPEYEKILRKPILDAAVMTRRRKELERFTPEMIQRMQEESW